MKQSWIYLYLKETNEHIQKKTLESFEKIIRLQEQE